MVPSLKTAEGLSKYQPQPLMICESGFVDIGQVVVAVGRSRYQSRSSDLALRFHDLPSASTASDQRCRCSLVHSTKALESQKISLKPGARARLS